MSFQLPVGRQRDFCLHSDARVNVSHGAVRSSKTIGANIRWLRYILEVPSEYNLLMTGRTLTSLERNVLLPIASLIGSDNFEYRRSLKVCTMYGRRIMCEGANDEAAFTKIAGLTLGGALVDEGSLQPESFFNMLISRLSEPGAQLFCTSNPGNPGHYLKKKWLDREAELDLRSWHFELSDNPHLDPRYVEELEAATTRNLAAPWRARKILETEHHGAFQAVGVEDAAAKGRAKKTWNTKCDKRVRPTHRALSGITISIDAVFWNGLRSPSGPFCRCYLTFSGEGPRRDFVPW